MESPPPEKQTVRVTILNRQYSLRAAGDPHDIERMAAHVDDLMLAIAAKAPSADSTHIAVLACLHLADKLAALDREMETLRHGLDRKSERVRGMIEELIRSAEEGL
jgi:cell division protein ZapA